MTAAEEGVQEIEGMHGLRVQYFGADVAAGFFGTEEKMQRELLRLIALEKDQGMTMEEKVEKAQAMYQSSLPEIAAADERGMREAAAGEQR
jgi:lipase chaperone LimK